MKISSQILLDIIEEEVYNVLKEGIFTKAFKDMEDIETRLLSPDQEKPEKQKSGTISQKIKNVLLELMAIWIDTALKDEELSFLNKEKEKIKPILLQSYLEQVDSLYNTIGTDMKENIIKERTEQAYEFNKLVIKIYSMLVKTSPEILENFRQKLDQVYNKGTLSSLFKQNLIRQIREESKKLFDKLNQRMIEEIERSKKTVAAYEEKEIKPRAELKKIYKEGTVPQFVMYMKEKNLDLEAAITTLQTTSQELKKALRKKVKKEYAQIKTIEQLHDYEEPLGPRCADLGKECKKRTDFLVALGISEDDAQSININMLVKLDPQNK